MKLDVQTFKGEAPRVSPRLLPAELAQIAQNSRLQSGDLEAFRQFVQTKVLSAFTPSAPVKTIYKLNGAWLSFKEQVDIARGLIPGDTTYFAFLTCPALYAVPQYTTYALATTGAEPYPVATRPLGMPAPTIAPTLVVGVSTDPTTFSVDITDDCSSLSNWVTTAQINDGDTQSLTVLDGAVGNPLPSFKTSVQNNTGAPAAITRDFGTTDASTIMVEYEVLPVDAGGGSGIATGFLFACDAPGGGARIVVRGDVGSNVLIEIRSGIILDDGYGPVLATGAGPGASWNLGVWYTVTATMTNNEDGTQSITAKVFNGITELATVTTTNHFPSGGIFGPINAKGDDLEQVNYDNIHVQASGSLAVTVVNTATSYVYTYKGANDWESAPSPASATVLRPDGVSVTVTTPTTTPHDVLYGIDTKVIYRAVTGATGTVYLLVDEIPLATADYVDELDDSVISTPGTTLPSEDWDLPPPTLQGIIALPNNCMAGFFLNQLCFSAQGFPHAWPVLYRLTTDTDIVSIKNVDNTVVVTTKAFVYTASGNDPSSYSMSQPGEAQACVAKRGTVYVDGYGVCFPSPDGYQVCAGSAGSVQNATAGIFTKAQWEALNPSSIIAAVYDGVLYWWFDGTTPDSGYALDTKTGGFGLVRLSHHILASYVDPELDALYMVLDANTEPVEALLPIASTAVTASALTIFQWDASATNRIRFLWRSRLNLLPYPTVMHFAKCEAEDYANLVLRVYADSVLIYTVRVLSAEAFRIPALKVYGNYETESIGTSRCWSAQLAQTVDELS